ncbi:hypothetical protein [Arthrobacter bambusae]|uniref:hypothetical protein n=1 Tax=Arthrobacter bambusae TaxID=1338426 RepID=UPI00278353DD|nr:hypothetical protein [Arthrobacter bambusae]MDQ0029841.1 hypothetical protein [Arthrobacter bambusae]MDQ0097641.1 hypothetical protein [Arthrobacter bambusae]
MSYSAPEPGPMNQPEPQQPYTQYPNAGQPTAVLQATGQEPPAQGWGQPQASEPFVPKKRFQMGRLTQILLAILLVAVGFFAGVGVTKAMDAGQTRPGRGQFQNFNGGQGRNRQSGAPSNGASPTAIPSAPATSAP